MSLASIEAFCGLLEDSQPEGGLGQAVAATARDAHEEDVPPTAIVATQHALGREGVANVETPTAPASGDEAMLLPADVGGS